MTQANFPEVNKVLAENQPEYQKLPVFHDVESGQIICAYKLNFRDKVRILFGGKVWVSVLTFNRGFQPIFLTTKKSDVLITTKPE